MPIDQKKSLAKGPSHQEHPIALLERFCLNAANIPSKSWKFARGDAESAADY
jgi:hypothetical protein